MVARSFVKDESEGQAAAAVPAGMRYTS